VGRFVHLLGRRVFVLLAIGVWACGLSLTLLPSVPAMLVGLAIFSSCGILVQATATGFVAISAPTGTSAAVGLYVFFFYLGGTIGGWLPGYAYETGGWPAVIAIVLTMLAAMATIVATRWREPQSGST
jgi:predicted MFS family arabinose efflux permease